MDLSCNESKANETIKHTHTHTGWLGRIDIHFTASRNVDSKASLFVYTAGVVAPRWSMSRSDAQKRTTTKRCRPRIPESKASRQSASTCVYSAVLAARRLVLTGSVRKAHCGSVGFTSGSRAGLTSRPSYGL